jgi:hypothetical protein
MLSSFDAQAAQILSGNKKDAVGALLSHCAVILGATFQPYNW